MILLNMKMPESCEDCPFNYDQQECCASYDIGMIFFDQYRQKLFGEYFAENSGKRHPRCPMKEVKENEN